MSAFSILVAGGASVRLPTAGKYCDRDIVVTAEEGGVELPELSSPGSAEDLMAGKELIDGNGNVVEGSFTLDEEMEAQDDLISQIQAALVGKATATGLPTQEKTVDITANGTYEALPDDGYTLAKVDVNVNVPIPDGYIKPTGTLAITKNGEHDAKAYEKVAVNVPIPDGYLIPNGTLEITQNGSHNVAAYESVDVDVPIPDGYIVPSGTKEINQNGTHDVTQYASVEVAVPDREIVLQDIEVTENGTYSAAAGYDGIGQVTVNVAASGGGGEDHLDDFLSGTLTEIDSNATKVMAYCGRGQTALTSVKLPNATSIGTYAFYGCNGITSLNTPKVTSLGTYAFYGCSKLVEVNFPKAATVPSTCFYQCSGLAFADFGAAKSIAGNAFAYCSKLKTLILRYASAVVTITSTSFSGFTFSGYVYVPKALLESYEADSTWSSNAPSAKFRAIEDYPDVCG